MGNDENGPIHGRRGFREHIERCKFPEDSIDPDEAYELLHTGLMLDGRETLNLASFVTTWMEPQAEKLIHDTLRKNHIDHEEYPAASLIEEACVHMLGDLFNAPDPSNVVGVGTIGSSEAIMLGLLAHKRSWRNRREAAGQPADRPNVVFGAETHVVWDKFANYFDVEMRKIPMRPDRFVLSADDVEAQIDENTIAVGAVLGTTHIGEADPISEINDLLVRIKAREGMGHPAARRRGQRRVHRPVRRTGAGVGLPPRAGRVDQRLRPQVRPRLSRRRLADLPRRVEAARGPRVQRELPGRGAADLHVQLLARLGDDPGADVQLPAARSQRVHRDRREHARQRPAPQREPRSVGEVRDPQPRARRTGRHVQAQGDPGFDVYHLSARLRENGWIVPAYSLPPDADDVNLMRIVVRLDLSRAMIDMLLRDLEAAYDALAAEAPTHNPAPKPDLWTGPRTVRPHTARLRTGLER